MGQITATRNLLATKVVRLAGQWSVLILGLGLSLGLQVLYSVTNCTGNILGCFTTITSNRARLQCSYYKQHMHLNTTTKKQQAKLILKDLGCFLYRKWPCIPVLYDFYIEPFLRIPNFRFPCVHEVNPQVLFISDIPPYFAGLCWGSTNK